MKEEEDKKQTKTTSKPRTWKDMEVGNFFNICLFLGSLPDVLRMTRVCRNWYTNGEKEIIWAKLCDRAGWPQLGRRWFLEKYVTLSTFRRPAESENFSLSHPILNLFAPSTKKVFNWRTGRVNKINTGLLCVAKSNTKTDLEIWDLNKANKRLVREEKSFNSSAADDAKRTTDRSWSAVACTDTKVVYADAKSAKIYVRELDTNTEYMLGKHDSTVTCVRTNNGNIAASGAYDKTVQVWDLQRLAKRYSFTVDQRVWAVGVHPDGSRVAGGTDDALYIWKTSDGKPLTTIYPPESDTILSIVFDPVDPDTRIFSGGCDAKVRMWDYTSKQCLRTFEGHSGIVFSITVSPYVLISASRDTKTRIYDRHTGDLLQELGGHTMDVRSVALVDPFKIVTGGYDREMNVWSFPKPIQDGDSQQVNDGSESGEGCVLQ
mmetsp:Transcript_31583/g.51304  ORF Transcript_31583/g.51304 Transcript_31583/m.51304 type:complete len:432 (-) Transcript_31583:122-1417(-)